jgi:hypothetical protein
VQAADDEVFKAMATDNLTWTEWRRGEGRYIVQDFVNCYEVNGLPKPPLRPEQYDDGIGHSRPRQYCEDAVERLEKALPRFQEFVSRIGTITTIEGSQYTDQLAALQAVRRDRLEWAREVVAKWDAQDMKRLQELLLADQPLKVREEQTNLLIDPNNRDRPENLP